MQNIHVIINADGKFDVVVKESSDVLYHTRQAYERIEGAHAHIRTMMKIFGTPVPKGVFFQDDTKAKPVVCYIDSTEVVNTTHKPGPKYEAE